MTHSLYKLYPLINQLFPSLSCQLAGHLSLSLVNPTKSSRTKRNTKENKEIEDYLKVRTKYSLAVRMHSLLDWDSFEISL